MLTSADKEVGSKKGPKHADVINEWSLTKIQQSKMLVRCQLFGDLFLFGLVWQYSINQNQCNKGRFKPWLLTCSSNIPLSLPSFTVSALKKELNFCNGYLILLYY